MFKQSLAHVRKFVESDDKIRVTWNVGDAVYWECGMLGLWDIGDVECWGYGMLKMWDVCDVGCWGYRMFGM